MANRQMLVSDLAVHDDVILAALFQTTDGWAPESVRDPGYTPSRRHPIQFIDILPRSSTTQELVRFMAETTYTNAALPVAPTASGYLVNGALAKGATSIVVDTGSGTIPAGSRVRFGTATTVYTVKTAINSDKTFTLTAGLAAVVADDAAVTVKDAEAATISATVLEPRRLTPDVLAQVGRSLIVRGEIVLILTVREGQVLLPPAASWDVTGTADPLTWRYRCDLAGPSGSTTIVRPAEGVIHCRYSTDGRGWGVGPLERARLSGRLSAELEAALGDEASGTRGYVLPIPSDGQDASVSDLRRDIGSLGGKTALVETAMAGWGDGRIAAPQGGYEPKRLGANPPASLATLRSDAAQAVLSACGVPVELVTPGDGTGQREAWRRFLHGTVQPLAACVAGELAAKLDTPGLMLNFDRLFASDLSGRARAFQSMVGGGMAVDQAAALAGLLTEE